MGTRGQAMTEMILLIVFVVLLLVPVILAAERAVARFHRDVTETVALPVP